MWNDTMDGGEAGNGWAGGETSFMTDKKADNKSTTLGDRLPVPATISMLNNNFDEQEDKYVIGNFRFATVILVGNVKQINVDGSQYNYTLGDLEDNDQEFTVVKFDNGRGFDSSAIVEGTCVRAIGKLKGFDGNKVLTLFNIFPMEDEKDQTIFSLEAQAARLFFQKNLNDKLRSDHTSSGFVGMLAPPRSRQSSQQSSQNSQVGDTRERIYKTEQKPAQSGSMAERIRSILESATYEREEGLALDWIAEQVQEENLEKVRNCLAELVDEGYIYSTGQDDCYSII